MSSPPTKPFPFLSLPAEVRNKIYSHLLPESIGLTDAFGFSDWELDRFVSFPPHSPFDSKP